ncbi:MAG: UDP-glucose 4-epimerase GalE [Bacillota bacterium]|nr:UDP-glucose 4-epimerase GalE [Bacillota bacterium]
MSLILVAGGAGYIGSHTSVALLEAGYEVVIADNLSNSDESVIGRIEQIVGKDVFFEHLDLTEQEAVGALFDKYRFDGVIHFAAYKAVGESVEKPLEYYYNNIVTTIRLVEACRKYEVKNFVFSSSCTVYGDNKAPFVESMPLKEAINPYGETKKLCEQILRDITAVDDDFAVALLRYFNPVGAHESGLIGELPKGIPNNLMPYVSRVARGELEKLYVFGDDYPTVDGTGVRDYIHVVDLAEGHLAALKGLKRGVEAFNLGMGKGTSVLELIMAFEKVTGMKIPYEIVGRRQGDIAAAWADVTKVRDILGWQAQRSIGEMCRDAWNFEKNIK